LDALLDIWTEVTNAGGAVGLVPPVTKDDVAAVSDVAFERVRSGRDRLLVAYADDVVVGFLFLEHRPGPLFKHWATVKRLQVRPSLQGTGYGGKILELLHQIAQERLKLEQLHLTVRGGTGTESFYERYGYSVAARIPGVIRVALGDDREEIYMVKRL
jgi:GNAT superfamily N-acetyltransferase